MMLIGIVKKNAIMQIDFALEAERKEGKSPAEAIYEGCLIRFRPIMMTHYGGDAGRNSDFDRLWRRRRIAASVGAGGGRRPVLLAIDHVVSDAGSVYVHGGRVGLVAAAARTDNAPG